MTARPPPPKRTDWISVGGLIFNVSLAILNGIFAFAMFNGAIGERIVALETKVERLMSDVRELRGYGGRNGP